MGCYLKLGRDYGRIITLSKTISATTRALRFSYTFGGVLIYLSPCKDLDFHCQFIEKPDKCQWPELQDSQAYLVIARRAGSQDLQRGVVCVVSLSFIALLSFEWPIWTSNLISFIVLEVPPERGNANTHRKQMYYQKEPHSFLSFFPMM